LKKILFLVFSLSLSAFTYSQTSISDSIYVDGEYRPYRLYIPAVYDAANAVPLVFNLHAFTQTNVYEETYADFRPVADTADFIIALPEGDSVHQASLYNLGWDNFNSVADAAKDLNFISCLIDTIKSHYNIDLSRVYACGYSNGGFMSYDLACFLNSRIAAVASVAGTMIASHDSACNPAHPTPIMEIHGMADSCVTWTGISAQCPTLLTIHCTDIDTLVHHWVLRNNCSGTPIITNVPNNNWIDGCTAKHYVFNGGEDGSSVELFKVAGGGHTWPGSGFILNGGVCMDFNACDEIWRFFRKYSLDSLEAGKNEWPLPENNMFKMYPNPFYGVITVESPEAGKKNFEIYNVLGKLLLQYSTEDLKTELNLAGLPKDVYIMKINDNKRSVIKKIILE
jgi:polyhydroxybutyrate depolymerase